jgi:Skp family chaperone for outer membrane proteins
MKTTFKSALAATALGAALIAAPQAFAAKKDAPAASGVVSAIGVINPEGILVSSTAFQTAEQQRPVTYKATIDAAQAREAQIQAQLKPLADKFNTDRAAAKPNNAALQQQFAQIQQLRQSGDQELQEMLQPLELSRQYVIEQIEDKLGTAVDQAMAKRGVSIVLRRDAVIKANGAYDLNQAVLTELNALIPSAQLVPPQGWMPRAEREAAAQRAAQQGAQQGGAAAKPAQPAGPAPDGR